MLLSVTGFLGIIGVSILFVLLLQMMLRKNALVQHTGIGLYLVILGLIAFRAFVPVEFGFEKAIALPVVLPWLRNTYLEASFVLFGQEIFLRHVLFTGWGIGSVLAAFFAFRRYQRFQKSVFLFSSACDKRVLKSLGEMSKTDSRLYRTRVLQNASIKTPMVFGFLRPVVILPQITLTEQDWRYVLSHELSHFYHGDLWVKLFCQLICVVYWWNPLGYLLRKQVNKLLEIQNDLRVTASLSEQARLEYLGCLLKVAKATSTPNSQTQEYAAALLGLERSNLRQRFFLVDKQLRPGICNKRQVIMTVLACAVLCFSYSYVLEPDYECPDPDAKSLTTENAYIVKNGDLFDIYVDDYLFLTVTHPKYAYVKLPIYNTLSEVP